jgi:hypothetical protein
LQFFCWNLWTFGLSYNNNLCGAALGIQALEVSTVPLVAVTIAMPISFDYSHRFRLQWLWQLHTYYQAKFFKSQGEIRRGEWVVSCRGEWCWHDVSLDKLGMVQTLDDDFQSMRSYMVGKVTLMGRRTWYMLKRSRAKFSSVQEK